MLIETANTRYITIKLKVGPIEPQTFIFRKENNKIAKRNHNNNALNTLVIRGVITKELQTNRQYVKQQKGRIWGDTAFFVFEALGLRSRVAPQRCSLSSSYAKIAIIRVTAK